MSHPISVNAYGLRDMLRAQGYGPVAPRIAESGANAFEPMLALEHKQTDVGDEWVWSVERSQEYRTILPAGLAIPSAHLWPYKHGSLVSSATMAHFAKAHFDALGTPWFVASCTASSEEEWRAFGAFLRQANAALADTHCRIAYHPHDTEFRPLGQNGVRPIDIIREEAGSAFFLQYDVGWAWFAGNDEIETAREFACEIVLIHLKDFHEAAAPLRGGDRNSIPFGFFAPVGAGVVRISELVDLAHTGEFPAWDNTLTIDQDHSGGNMYSDIAEGVRSLCNQICLQGENRMHNCTSDKEAPC